MCVSIYVYNITIIIIIIIKLPSVTWLFGWWSFTVKGFWIFSPLSTRGDQKVMQHISFLGPVLLDKNNILRAAVFKRPAFMHVVAMFPAR
jgi:hypothetical protein